MIRWGILGAGSIAHALAEAIAATEGCEVAAVGSRLLEKAEAFGGDVTYGTYESYGSYEELAKDPSLDVIYVATPHPFHCENTLLCLEHGKAVLCEKPFAMNARQGREMAKKARERGLLLMEAMWTRFFPLMARVRELVEGGEIGRVKIVSADFGFRAGPDPESRLLSPKLGGGSLLDVGVYALSFASMILGKPSKVASMMQPAATGVDGQAGVVLGYAGGEMALLYSSLEAQTPWEATVVGDKGRIRIHTAFWRPSKMTLTTEAGDELIEMPYEGNGYQFQVEEVNRSLRTGLKESPIMPLDETISIQETMDEVRGQWGLKYPGE